jgi:hypothetical protein
MWNCTGFTYMDGLETANVKVRPNIWEGESAKSSHITLLHLFHLSLFPTLFIPLQLQKFSKLVQSSHAYEVNGSS